MNQKFVEKTVSSQQIFDGKIIKVFVDTVELPNGKHATREIVRHPGAVGILAVTKENRVLMVKQYRKPMNQFLYEIPAGKLEPGEDPKLCAIRELKEETGYVATNMTPFSKFYTSPGFADEFIHLFYAEGIEAGEATPDEDEFVELVELTLDESIEMIEKGKIVDAKTIISIYYLQMMLLKGREK
ncbi:NUDIX hydrolase [Tepidibacillus fermentans]|uniref:ADP-ribose pyrophosphatase n=1 Tax=Tepidibacillus fermentans TaxID=1281767 RepID=A0A4R3KKN9_9BACI|nr:NUDIX hydrolase [Tepidibacillus fermentans]TCS84072.1 ADP-ribose pyrophosphatase [Tepidibacillus fermentans]